MTKVFNLNQEKAELLKTINFLYQSPELSREKKEEINLKLRKIQDDLKSTLLK